jgi:hypothetical protein
VTQGCHHQRTVGLPIFRARDNNSPNTIYVRELRRRVESKVDERRRTLANETKDESTKPPLYRKTYARVLPSPGGIEPTTGLGMVRQ